MIGALVGPDGVFMVDSQWPRSDRSRMVASAKLLADFDGKVQQAGTTGDRFIGQVYADLKAAK